jgi:hypothetical protein
MVWHNDVSSLFCTTVCFAQQDDTEKSNQFSYLSEGTAGSWMILPLLLLQYVNDTAWHLMHNMVA